MTIEKPLVTGAVSQLNLSAQPNSKAPHRDSINTNLEFCANGDYQNPNITKEQLQDIEKIVKSAMDGMDDQSIELENLAFLFTEFLDDIDICYKQNGTDVYYDGERLTNGFKIGLDLIKKGFEYEQARKAFYHAFSSA